MEPAMECVHVKRGELEQMALVRVEVNNSLRTLTLLPEAIGVCAYCLGRFHRSLLDLDLGAAR